MQLPNGHYTAVLLDPDLRWLEAVELVLERAGVDVLVRTTSVEQALAVLTEREPDLFVTETCVNGKQGGGIDCIRDAKRRLPELKAVVLAADDDQKRVAAAFDAGAVAYVVKPQRPGDLQSAVRRAFRGSIYLTPPAMSASHERTPPRKNGGEPTLTRRERQILRLVMQGLSNTEIAQTLWVTEPTVKFHLSNLYRKLGVSNRAEATRWAREHGLRPLVGSRSH